MKHTYDYKKEGEKGAINNYVLLSNSPRRKELLAFLNPTTIPTDIDEREIEEQYMDHFREDPYLYRVGKTCCEISKAKADIEKEPGTLYISADTMVVMEKQIYNKPKDMGEARKMFLSYFGKTHHVITSVCLATAESIDLFYTIAEVEFIPYYNELSVLINDYLTEENVMDKAGAYGIQDLDPRFIKRIGGDINTIIGLPVSDLVYRIYN